MEVIATILPPKKAILMFYWFRMGLKNPMINWLEWYGV
jgi:hypothetical protein